MFPVRKQGSGLRHRATSPPPTSAGETPGRKAANRGALAPPNCRLFVARVSAGRPGRLRADAAGRGVAVCARVLPLGAPRPAPGTAASGLPIPRFVSLKSDRVNMRNGPSTEYPTSWVYKRAGLPLEVIKEYEGWREVRDADGATGWVLQSFLSGRRTALVPWEVKPDKPVPRVALKAGDSSGSASLAEMEAGVIANLLSCDRKWCHVTIGDYRGYLEQKQLWGVYPDEVLK